MLLNVNIIIYNKHRSKITFNINYLTFTYIIYKIKQKNGWYKDKKLMKRDKKLRNDMLLDVQVSHNHL